MLEVLYQTSLTRKTSSINPVPTIATRFTCNRRRKSACWRNSSQAFPNIFSKQCWWWCRWSLYRVCCCAMTSCFGRWWKTRLILQEGLLELLLELGWYLVKVGVLRTWSPPINFNCPSAVFDVKCPPIWARSTPSRWALRCGSLTRLFLSTCSRSATKRVPFQTSLPAYQTYSRSDSGNTVLPNWWNFNRSKTEMEW